MTNRPSRLYEVTNCVFCHWHSSNFRIDLGSWDECEHPDFTDWYGALLDEAGEDEKQIDPRQPEYGRIIDVPMEEPPPDWCPLDPKEES